MRSRIHLVATVVVAALAGSLAPAVVSSPASAQEQTSWHVNDAPSLHGPSRYWYWGDPGHGYGSNYYRYTYGIAGESSPDNWARWSMGRRVGRQEIQAYVPSNHATATVVYRIDVGGREYTRRVAQRSVSGWTSLGRYDADGERVTITVRDNEASQHHSRHGLAASRIGVDAIRMRCTSRCGGSSPPPPPPTTTTTTAPPPPPSSSSGSSGRSGCGVASLGSVSGSVSRGGSWSAGCASATRSGHYARLFEFSLSGGREVTIDLESAVDAYLYLLDGGGSRIADDDDGGEGTNSRITQTLGSGTYRIEATTYSPAAAGDFELTVRVAASDSPPQARSSDRSGGCSAVGGLRGEAGVIAGVPSGAWDAGCASEVRGDGGHLARRYRLEVRDAGEVTIELSSETTDTYLILLDEAGEVIAEDDDGGSGTDSRIVRQLAVGAYIVEATTYSAGQAGDFVLGVTVRSSSPPPPPPPSSPPPASQRSGSSSGCGVVSLGAVGGGSTSSTGQWSAGCTSGTRSGRYARLFEFSLSVGREVTIDLESDVDTYLYLLDGEGSPVADDDDGGSGTNSRITRPLSAGTYRVETTTYSPGAAGDFTLRIAAGAGATAPTLSVGDDARPSGRCSSAQCRWLRITNLRPGSRVECWREGMGSAFGSFTARSATSTRGCYFSYVGARVYVVADGARSNTITWPPASESSSSSQASQSSECPVERLQGNWLHGIPYAYGEWAADCQSHRRSGSFARVFEIHTANGNEITIDLESDIDTYLYLYRVTPNISAALDDNDAGTYVDLSEFESGGTLIAQDDDGGSGTNSRITQVLGEGTHIIVATTYSPGEAGDFTLLLTDHQANWLIEDFDSYSTVLSQQVAGMSDSVDEITNMMDSLDEYLNELEDMYDNLQSTGRVGGQYRVPTRAAVDITEQIENAIEGVIDDWGGDQSIEELNEFIGFFERNYITDRSGRLHDPAPPELIDRRFSEAISLLADYSANAFELIVIDRAARETEVLAEVTCTAILVGSAVATIRRVFGLVEVMFDVVDFVISPLGYIAQKIKEYIGDRSSALRVIAEIGHVIVDGLPHLLSEGAGRLRDATFRAVEDALASDAEEEYSKLTEWLESPETTIDTSEISPYCDYKDGVEYRLPICADFGWNPFDNHRWARETVFGFSSCRRE